MTTRLDRALSHTLRFEGGWSDDPDDPGGATNYGVSLRFLRATGVIEAFDYDGDGDVDRDDIAVMTKDDARAVYARYFWKAWMNRAEVPEILAAKTFDFGVNMGPGQAGRLLQSAVNEVFVESLRIDGIIGPLTIDALVLLDDDDRGIAEALGDLEDHAARFYYGLAERRARSRKYLFGWLRRAYARPAL